MFPLLLSTEKIGPLVFVSCELWELSYAMLKILLVTFKILHGVAPSYLNDLVSVLPDSHYQLRRNNNGILLERPRLRTKKTMGDRAFSIAAPFLMEQSSSANKTGNINRLF